MSDNRTRDNRTQTQAAKPQLKSEYTVSVWRSTAERLIKNAKESSTIYLLQYSTVYQGTSFWRALSAVVKTKVEGSVQIKLVWRLDKK